MTLLTHSILFALATPALFASAYLLTMTLLSGRQPPPQRSSRKLRFDVIVPAHNESEGISGVVANLHKLDWPADGYRILVVADNCVDSTAERARAAGAKVLVRRDPEYRGKGYALSFAFEASRTHGWADAVVVVDADTEASANLLEAFAARIEVGAKAVQAHYGVLNAQASWRTRLLSIAMAAFHRVRSRGRERLHLSSGLRGNGWCVTHRTLSRTPYRAFSLVEDVEYGIELGLAGRRVHYADEACVAAAMVVGERAARTQRQRWEGGRLQLMRAKTRPLLRAFDSSGRFAKPRGRICFDLALDLCVPPLSYLVLYIVGVVALAGIALAWESTARFWLWAMFACATSLALYVLRGWRLSGVGARGLFDLLRIPIFIVWKLLLPSPARGGVEWVRTERERS